MNGSQGIDIRSYGDDYEKKRYKSAESVPLPTKIEHMALGGALSSTPPHVEWDVNSYLNSGEFVFGYIDPWSFHDGTGMAISDRLDDR